MIKSEDRKLDCDSTKDSQAWLENLLSFPQIGDSEFENARRYAINEGQRQDYELDRAANPMGEYMPY